MKIIQAAPLLVLASMMITFALVSFTLYPQSISFALTSPTFLVEAIAIGGFVFAILAVRMLGAVNKQLPG